MLSPSTHSAADVVRLLKLEPIPQEGGFFRRTLEASHVVRLVDGAGAEGRLAEPRRAWSAIYALFTPEGFSALHRLTADELWFFHAGDPLESLRLHADGRGERVRLGSEFAHGERLQDVVRAGVWQGTRLAPGGRWALVSCVVAPEFVWSDFELGSREELARAFPGFAADVRAVTR